MEGREIIDLWLSADKLGPVLEKKKVQKRVHIAG
jgi:hypothetical protein